MLGQNPIDTDLRRSASRRQIAGADQWAAIQRSHAEPAPLIKIAVFRRTKPATSFRLFFSDLAPAPCVKAKQLTIDKSSDGLKVKPELHGLRFAEQEPGGRSKRCSVRSFHTVQTLFLNALPVLQALLGRPILFQ